MASINTEKPAKETQKKKEVRTPKKKMEVKTPLQKTNEEIKKIEETEKKPTENKKDETKKPERKIEKTKKPEAIINLRGLPISTKKASDICKFIKWKRLGDAIREMEMVHRGKLAVPMKGEIPHRKGKIMSGGFPKKASESFIMALKSLAGNAHNNLIDEPIIVEAVANMGSRPYGRFGSVKRKRTHLVIRVKEKSEIKKK